MLLPSNIIENSGIYAIFCRENGLVYIGRSARIKARFFEHLNALNSKRHHNNRLQHCWNKYGKDSFEFLILDYCSEEECESKEIFWMLLYKTHTSDYGFNILFDIIDRLKQNKIQRKQRISEERRRANQMAARKRAIEQNYAKPLLTEASRKKANLAKRGKKFPNNAISQSLNEGGRIWWYNFETNESFFGTTSELRINKGGVVQEKLSSVLKQNNLSHKGWTNLETWKTFLLFSKYFKK